MKLLRIDKKDGGRYLKKYELVYENKSGREKKYEIVSHHEIDSPADLGNSTSGISMAVLKDGKLLLLKEFRMGINKEIYNLCAGMIEPGETIEDCIRRELYEETGLQLKRIIDILNPSFAAVSISDIRTQIVVLEAEGNIEDHTSENEKIQAAFYTKEECRQLLDTAEFSSRCQVMVYFFTKNAFKLLDNS